MGICNEGEDHVKLHICITFNSVVRPRLEDRQAMIIAMCALVMLLRATGLSSETQRPTNHRDLLFLGQCDTKAILYLPNSLIFPVTLFENDRTPT